MTAISTSSAPSQNGVVPMMYWEDDVDLDKVPSILEYVYAIDDIKENPSVQEYKKLKKIMKIMVRFYERGSKSKRQQWEEAQRELTKIDADRQMIRDQIASLAPFPDSHPKKKVFTDALHAELRNLDRLREPYANKVAEYESLERWSDDIVAACKWLEATIEEYCNSQLPALHQQLRVREPLANERLEQVHKYAKGLDEITFNLQESADFFDASLDGRLQMFHQLEKCMVEAQIQAVLKHDESLPRRQFVLEDLRKDLEHLADNTQETDDKLQHKVRMRQLHRDFLCVLRWQRRRVKKVLGVADVEPENIEQLEAAAPKRPVTDFAACPVMPSGTHRKQ